MSQVDTLDPDTSIIRHRQRIYEYDGKRYYLLKIPTINKHNNTPHRITSFNLDHRRFVPLLESINSSLWQRLALMAGPCLSDLYKGESVFWFGFLSSPPPLIREDILFLMMLHFVNVVFSSGEESSAPPGHHQVQADLEILSSDGFCEREDETNFRLIQ